jgi:hypothetical protein
VPNLARFGRKVAASATILADEGCKFLNEDGRKTLQRETYIVECNRTAAGPSARGQCVGELAGHAQGR